MKDLLKKGAKGVGSLGKSAVSAAISGIVGEMVKEILEETGVTNIAKDKMMSTGMKVAKDLNISPANLQRDLFKTMMMKELGLK